jgi:hypothetical protein
VVVEQDHVGLQRLGTAQRFAGIGRIANHLQTSGSRDSSAVRPRRNSVWSSTSRMRTSRS